MAPFGQLIWTSPQNGEKQLDWRRKALITLLGKYNATCIEAA
jgi:hypothetical protein